ncbi:uncharacterized protein ALTATR162_LOCUS3244 [Alternaria atra]|uniref:Uncharacterized protein n=1 Tax=Alternaria atra TaxID=119953 RepID=A0A8J2HZX7_9PLEO|nr:uncharacterized protein ALTATR162_LOCUS3244 [Alternaria atra]CAG5153592.1 unnamed protein product [Alternaria atra]
MFFKTVTLALLASSAFAATIQQRQGLNPSVQLCSNKDFNDCDTVNFHYGICQSAGRLNDKVSSLKANGHNCIFYNDTGCRNGGGQIATTGDVANIRSDSSHSTMNDDVSSFLCNI